MDMRWSLDGLYSSFDSEEFKNDMDICQKEIRELKKWVNQELSNDQEATRKAEDFINRQNQFYLLFSRLYSYAELILSVEAKNETALSNLEKLEGWVTELTEPEVQFSKWLSGIQDLDSVISSSELLKEHQFFLKELVERNKYLLSEKEEVIISKMKNTGSNSWSKLQELLTSTLLVDMTVDGEKKQLPLSVVRNMAYEKDKDLRKNAYEAELESYKKIEESSAACLNGIKGEVITVSKMRGYRSPLDKTLMDSRMDEEILTAMLSAIRESLPVFHKYYRKKAELLGHQKGLPFYDLFAPIGNADIKFTYDEARTFIVKQFGSFSKKLADFADHAFENRWIDAEPREGKRGGAFCANLHVIKESRILANFTGSFNDVSTIAHELGHGYHGACLNDESYLNTHYPMPLAETASIFCETIVKNAAIQDASPEVALTILESDISNSAQVIVDIYSRFLFESELFHLREEGSLSVNQLQDIMINAQKEAYGDGLDPDYLHPYMWACKPHYYYAEQNFYNFPYAFGLLFANGLYAEYLQRGEEFIQQYDQLLSVTGKMKAADVAKTMGIDLRSTDFWRNSLRLVEQDIEAFINMV